jgi:hypothetical protein
MRLVGALSLTPGLARCETGKETDEGAERRSRLPAVRRGDVVL